MLSLSPWFCGMLMPSALLFLLGVALAIWDLLCFQMNFSSVFSTPMKNAVGVFNGKCKEMLISFGNMAEFIATTSAVP